MLQLSLVIVWLFFTAAEAMPEILNDNFGVIQGAPFTLSISGCNASCSVVLQESSIENPVDVRVLNRKQFLPSAPSIKELDHIRSWRTNTSQLECLMAHSTLL